MLARWSTDGRLVRVPDLGRSCRSREPHLWTRGRQARAGVSSRSYFRPEFLIAIAPSALTGSFFSGGFVSSREGMALFSGVFSLIAHPPASWLCPGSCREDAL